MAAGPGIDDVLLDATAAILHRGRTGRSLSLSSVADEAGISRVTLHRRVGRGDLLAGVGPGGRAVRRWTPSSSSMR